MSNGTTGAGGVGGSSQDFSSELAQMEQVFQQAQQQEMTLSETSTQAQTVLDTAKKMPQ